MPSVIAKQPKDTRKQTTVSLSGSVLADLELYCRFIDSARDWVINEALKTVFRRDKAFHEWKQRPGAVASQTHSCATGQVSGPVQMPLEPNGRPERVKPHRVPAPEPPSAA